MMMMLKICAIAVVGLVLIALIRSYKPEFTVEAVLCVSIILPVLRAGQPALRFRIHAEPIQPLDLWTGIFSDHSQGAGNCLRDGIYGSAL